MRLLIVTSRFPFPLEKGDKLRMYHQLRYLQERHEVVLVSLTARRPTEDDIREIEPFCEALHIFRIPRWKRIYNALKGFLRGWPLQVGYFFDEGVKRKIRRLMIREDFDQVYCQLVRTSEYVRSFPIPKTIDYMDALSTGILRRAGQKKGLVKWLYVKEGMRLQRYERSIFTQFDRHTIISDRDREEFDASLRPHIDVVPNGLNVAYFLPQSREPEFDIVFVGNMGYEPNAAAAVKLIEWTKDLQIEGKPLRILIAGARPAPRVRKLASESVTISGWMEDIRDAYSAAKVFAAPVFTGAGLQNKILESMGMGIPCVTTSMVNASIHATPGESILVADDKSNFQKAIASLVTSEDKRQQMSHAALDFVRTNYSWEEFNGRLEDILAKPIPKYGYQPYDNES